MSDVHDLLNAQIGHEFTASQQYVAIAVWYDRQALPKLAAHFYAQALEERNHAMMITQYLMDRDAGVTIPGIPAVRTEFASVAEPIELALQQERQVTAQFEKLIALARREEDFLGEQFMHWFLKEQVEEVSAMSTLLQVAHRVGENVMLLEDYLARETVGDAGGDPTAPSAAGGRFGAEGLAGSAGGVQPEACASEPADIPVPMSEVASTLGATPGRTAGGDSS